MKILVSLLLLLSVFGLQAQSKRINKKLMDEQTKWHSGSLNLSDGSSLNGLIQYNDKIGSLSLRTEIGTESYSANTVIKFHFFDNDLNTTREFISLDYPVEHLRNNIVASFSLSNQSGERIIATFFEVLRETKQFALLSKIRPIEFKQKSQGHGYFAGSQQVSNPTITEVEELRQNEILFFLSHQGDMMPYMELISKEVDTRKYVQATFSKVQSEVGKLRTKKSVKVKNVDSELLAKITGDHFIKLEEFIKTNELDVEDKDDLLKIIDYYISLKK